MAPRSRRRTRQRKPGRPNAGARPDVRDSLLTAAGDLGAKRGLGEVSLRELAHEAGVTPSMVHYYFGDKQGLHDAMLERALARVLATVRSVLSEADATEDPIAALVSTFVKTFTLEPWIPPLLVREVFAEGGRFQERFIRDYASQMAPLVRGVVQREIDAGRMRTDLDPTLAFLSLIGMSMFPFVARPVAQRVLGLRFDAAFGEAFAEHTRRLYAQGTQA